MACCYPFTRDFAIVDFPLDLVPLQAFNKMCQITAVYVFFVMTLVTSCEWVSYAVLGKGGTAGTIVGTVIPILITAMAFRDDSFPMKQVIEYSFENSGWTTEQKLRIMKTSGMTDEEIAEAAKEYAAEAAADASNQTPAPSVVESV
jgi:hypothetical protein